MCSSIRRKTLKSGGGAEFQKRKSPALRTQIGKKGRIKLKEDHFISEFEKRKISKNRENIKGEIFFSGEDKKISEKEQLFRNIFINN